MHKTVPKRDAEYSKPSDKYTTVQKHNQNNRQAGDISIETRDRDNVEVIEAEFCGLRKEVGRVYIFFFSINI